MNGSEVTAACGVRLVESGVMYRKMLSGWRRTDWMLEIRLEDWRVKVGGVQREQVIR